ncbi:hypothetical protein INP83_12190 [Mucilaginibacter sp. 21P]|nr:hypothetical protein INP83_12190 [Mucilaginibacter sp. 21P]
MFSEVGTELSLKDFFFEHPTISRLSAYLSGRKQGSYRQISPLPRQEHYALSHAQKLIWVLDQSTDEMIAYNMPASCLLNGELDKDAFVKNIPNDHLPP